MIRFATQSSLGSRLSPHISCNVRYLSRGPAASTKTGNGRAGWTLRSITSSQDKPESKGASEPSNRDVQEAAEELMAALGSPKPRRRFPSLPQPGERPSDEARQPQAVPGRRPREEARQPQAVPGRRPREEACQPQAVTGRTPSFEDLVGKALDLLQTMAKSGTPNPKGISLQLQEGNDPPITPPNNSDGSAEDSRLAKDPTDGGEAATHEEGLAAKELESLKAKEKKLESEKAKEKKIESEKARELEKLRAKVLDQRTQLSALVDKYKNMQNELRGNREQMRKMGKMLQADPKTRESVAADGGQQQAEGQVTAVDQTQDQARPSTETTTTKKKTKSKKTKAIKVMTVRPGLLSLQAIDKPTPPVPQLKHGLDRALFNPGVYHLRDPRSRVWNFDPYLSSIMPTTEFDFDALRKFTRPSRDETLLSLAREIGSKYAGSTSSTTQLLSHFHFLLSGWRSLNLKPLSRTFVPESSQFTLISRVPAATFLSYKDGVYALDADKEFDSASILSMLGQSMEKLLTLPKEDYEKFRRSRSLELSEEERLDDPASYHYTTFRDFLMRSQLDAHDPRVPGTGVFDLKTRAVVSIRMDVANPENGEDYQIRSRFGQFESFEREYYDLMRSAFLKYSLQCRMGRMDGIFVTYHNTKRIFGFQYISLAEMDLALHGTENPRLGDEEFKMSLHLLNEALDRATARFPNQDLRLHIETRPSTVAPFMYIFAKPVTETVADRIQNANQEQIKQMEMRIRDAVVMGEQNKRAEAVGEGVGAGDKQLPAEGDQVDDCQQPSSLVVWEDIMESVEEALENDQQGKTFIRDTVAQALEESGLLQDKTAEESNGYLDALMEQLLLGERDAGDAEAAPVVEAGEAEIAEKTEQAEELEHENQEAVEETAEENAEEATELLEEGEDIEATPEATLEAAQGAVHEAQAQAGVEDSVSEAEVEVQDSVNEAEVEDAAQEVSSETNSVDASPVESSDTNKSRALRDLMRRLVKASFKGPRATRAEPEANGTEEVAEDTAKLRRFEVILAEMVQNAASSSAASSEEDKVVLDLSDDGSSETANSAEELELTEGPVYGMLLTTRNKVKGQYVTRPDDLKDSDEWTAEYTFTDIPDDKANDLYRTVVRRRSQAMGVKRGTRNSNDYRAALQSLSRDGREWREKEDNLDRTRPVHIVGQDGAREWTEVFKQE